MKTKEELKEIKEEVEEVSKKLQELTDEELEQVTGGMKAIKVTHSANNMGTQNYTGTTFKLR